MMTSTTQRTGPLPRPERPRQRLHRASGGRIGLIVAGSLAAGLAGVALLVWAPFIAPRDSDIVGAVLLAFAFGWALLAALSVRLSDQPQGWAAGLALFMGLAGVVTLIAPGPVRAGFGWVWPPLLLGLVCWAAARARRQLRNRVGHWLVYPLLAALLLASVGGGFATVGESIDAAAYPMPGRLVDVGGHRLHLSCTGSGSPVVVLEPGLGEPSPAMGWIAPTVARTTTVCVYDRAGRGWSEPAAGPQDGAQTAADLHTLLERAHVPGPYVLAGHSFGGLYVEAFAAAYPAQVAGLVLLDSTAPATPGASPGGASPSDTDSYDPVRRIAALVSATAHLGVARAVGQLSYGSLPPRARGEARASLATSRNVRSFIYELVEGGAAAQQPAALVDLGDKPLVVVTAGRGHDAAWLADQDKLATLSTNSRHRILHGATHSSLVLEEPDAAAASRAVTDVVASVRTSRRLV